MHNKTRLKDLRGGKKRTRLSLLAKKRIIGVSTMILAGLLMAVPFFTRAVEDGYVAYQTDITDDTTKVEGFCGTQENGTSVKWYLAYPDSMENRSAPDTAPLTLFVEINTEYAGTETNNGIIRDFTIASGNDNRPWSVYLSRIKNIVVGDGVTQIGAYAFADTHWDTGAASTESPYPVENVSLPGSLNRIGRSAFNRSGLQTITFATPSTTEPLKIEESAFEHSSLTTVTFPNSLRTIEGRAFYNADALTTVNWFTGNNASAGALTEIGTEAFAECNVLSGTLTFPDTLQKIGNRAFYNDTLLTGTLLLPAQLESIGDMAFSKTGITGDLSIPARVTQLGESAFEGCAGLNGALTMTTGLTEIQDRTFADCSGLTSVTIGPNVTTIGAEAFKNCAALTSPIVIPENVTSIGAAAFQGTDAATRIRFNGDAPTVVGTTATNTEHTFDKADVILFTRENTTFESALTPGDDGNARWEGYWVSRIDPQTNAEVVYPAFGYSDHRTQESAIGNATASLKTANSSTMMDDGKGYRLEIRDLNVSETDNLKERLTLGSNDIYHPYELTLWNDRVSPSVEVKNKTVGEIEVVLPLPTEIATAVRVTIEQGLTTAVTERLKVYAIPLSTSANANSYEEIDFTEGTDTNGNHQITFTATHFSQYALVYDSARYGAEEFKVIDQRSDAHQNTNSILYKGVANEGAPEEKEFVITNGLNHATAVMTPGGRATTSAGYRLEISRSEGRTIREAEWAATGRGVLLDQYRMFAPVEIKLYYNDGVNTTTDETVTENFGEMLIRLPIPEEMDITARGSTLQVLSVKADASGKNMIEVKSVANQSLEIRELENSNVKYAVFRTDHFSEFALYYIVAEDSSTTASTSSTAASTATGAATTDSAAASTTATGAATTSGASSTGASNASVAATSGASGATNRSGATTPTATGGGSATGSTTDMPRTGDSDFYRMTLSAALMLFGAYELISTIRIRRRRV